MARLCILCFHVLRKLTLVTRIILACAFLFTFMLQIPCKVLFLFAFHFLIKRMEILEKSSFFRTYISFF